MVRERVTIKNPTGLHARPASNLVKVANAYGSTVTLSFAGDDYNAKSILAVLGAAIKTGEDIEIICEGDDESEALTAIKEAIASGLGE